jgi:hypothetical protein
LHSIRNVGSGRFLIDVEGGCERGGSVLQGTAVPVRAPDETRGAVQLVNLMGTLVQRQDFPVDLAEHECAFVRGLCAHGFPFSSSPGGSKRRLSDAAASLFLHEPQEIAHTQFPDD